ncbi:MAG: enoyl-CoA hydratase/isomerase family protein [Chloroflexi bacterium]|nr:enoyl-CoA hydratase/isomerase family protein [Chloroflexota bacterium]
MSSTVLYEVRDKVARITLNRPEKLNAINSEMRNELFRVLKDVKDNPEVWLALITGTGRAFSVGHDLLEMADAGGHGPTTDDLYVFQLTIYKPIVVAINGICLAQGAGIVLCSDLRIASDRAQFGWPQVKRGIGSISGPCLLAHRIPLNFALQALLTGEFFSVEEAKRLNLVNEVVPHDQLMAAAEGMVERIRCNAPLAVRAIKEVTLRGLGLDLENRVRFAALMQRRIRASEDAQEGLRAFADKRQPVWQGR